MFLCKPLHVGDGYLFHEEVSILITFFDCATDALRTHGLERKQDHEAGLLRVKRDLLQFTIYLLQGELHFPFQNLPLVGLEGQQMVGQHHH